MRQTQRSPEGPRHLHRIPRLKAEVARRQQLQEASRNRDKADEPMATEPEPMGASEDAATQPPAAKDPSSSSLQG